MTSGSVSARLYAVAKGLDRMNEVVNEGGRPSIKQIRALAREVEEIATAAAELENAVDRAPKA